MKKKAKIPGGTKFNRARPALTASLRTGLSGIELIQVERAAGDVRAGVPVFVTSNDVCALVLAAETIEPIRIAESLSVSKEHEPFLLLTPERAAALKIRRYTPGAVAVAIEPDAAGIANAAGLADPSRDLDNPMRGPFVARREPLPQVALAALTLMKHANLLPSAIVWFIKPNRASKLASTNDILQVSARAVMDYAGRAARELRRVTQAQLPLLGAKNTRILAFRPHSGSREHLALLIGSPTTAKPPLVRLHSECLTGDLLRSLKCDCGDQLRGAIEKMGADPDGGILLYLAQEGRGIGLMNKLRAYDLQDQGFDTIDANTRLGFEADERRFEIASEILKRLGFATIRLLTNNPDKVASLERLGVEVTQRVAHAFAPNPHNAGYLKTKARKAGHFL